MEEALAKISTSLIQPEDVSLPSVTDITPDEIFKLAFLLSFANKVGSDLMVEWINDFLRLRISRLRMGRKEMLMLGIGTRDYSEKKGRTGISDLFSGLK